MRAPIERGCSTLLSKTAFSASRRPRVNSLSTVLPLLVEFQRHPLRRVISEFWLVNRYPCSLRVIAGIECQCPVTTCVPLARSNDQTDLASRGGGYPSRRFS